MVITSVENERIKNLCKLEKKKYRDLTNTYLIEGEHLVIEAFKAGVLDEIFVLEDSNFSFDVKTTVVSFDVMKKLSSMDTPINIIGLCHKNINNEIIGNKVVLLDEVQDPGNLGTIIRSSVAFNVDTIVVSSNTVDFYNDKVLRSSEGMLFHINIVRKNLENFIDQLHDQNYVIYGTRVDGGKELKNIVSRDKMAIIMGNEGSGVKKSILDKCDEYLYIPMNSNCESLNVGVATSIILYEMF